jgi:hypothetical protein
MAKKFPAHIERRALLHGIPAVDGWVLVTRDKNGADLGPWHIAWLEIFDRKYQAVRFARENGWTAPWKAVRGSLAVTIPAPKRRK